VVVRCQGVIKEKSPVFRFPGVGISATSTRETDRQEPATVNITGKLFNTILRVARGCLNSCDFRATAKETAGVEGEG